MRMVGYTVAECECCMKPHVYLVKHHLYYNTEMEGNGPTKQICTACHIMITDLNTHIAYISRRKLTTDDRMEIWDFVSRMVVKEPAE